MTKICLNCNSETHTEDDCPYKHEPTVPSENDEAKICIAPNCNRHATLNRKECQSHRYIRYKYGSYQIPKGQKIIRPVTKNEIYEWVALYKAGETVPIIAKKCNRNCSVIYSHLRTRVNIRTKSETKMGDKNPMWVGDKVSYHALHMWVFRHKPKPDLCEKCLTKEPKDLANISQEYHRDVNDYEWLCRRCHMLSDGRMNNLKQYRAK